MTVRTGVIGAGVVASNNHFSALSRNPRTELTAVCDVDADRAAEVAGEYGARAYTDADDMFDQESLDWVHVATPVETHYELGMRAVDAGVPLLLQKPATATRREFEDLTAHADAQDVPISVVHNVLSYPVVRELRRRIAAGDIGPVRAVQTTIAGDGRPDETYRGDWVFDLPGGALEEGMPHPFYLTLALGGYPAEESAIDTRTRLVGEYDRDIAYDGVQMQYVTDDETLCSVTYLTDSSRGTSLRVLGADGSLTVDLPTMTIDERNADAGPYHFPNERFRRNAAVLRDAAEGLARNLKRYAMEYVEDEYDVHFSESPDGHYYLIDRTARALDAGRQPPSNVEESYWTLTLVEHVRDAAQRRTVAPAR